VEVFLKVRYLYWTGDRDMTKNTRKLSYPCMQDSQDRAYRRALTQPSVTKRKPSMNKLFRGGAAAFLLSLTVLGAATGHAQHPGKKYAGKKVLYINSYHKGYEWSDAIEKSIASVIGGAGAELRVQYMDTKNHQDEEFKKKAALEAKNIIDEWKPDVVITSDDNAVHYVVVPYLKNTKTPVVFNGVNWDAEQYGLPCSDVTGMLEVDSADQMLKMLKTLKPGAARIGMLTPDTETEHQEITNLQKNFHVEYADMRYVKTFEDWKKNFLEMQEKVDVLQVQNNAGIQGWDNAAAKAFVLENTKVPTGSIDSSYMSPFSMILYAKVPEEQGEWSAQKALEILDGKSPADIPVARNVKGQIFVNASLVRKLGLKIPEDVLAIASITQ
jgi:ABC-type uncharacterized transport system substrate-binding protein